MFPVPIVSEMEIVSCDYSSFLLIAQSLHADSPLTKTCEEVRGEAVQAARNQAGRSRYFGG
jgi:predicted AAA+ superfamily ATPase